MLGCTHFPLLKALIGGVVGHDVTLISSAKEAARDVSEILDRHHQRAQAGRLATYEFYTTGNDIEEFQRFGSRAFCKPIERVRHLDLPA